MLKALKAIKALNFLKALNDLNWINCLISVRRTGLRFLCGADVRSTFSEYLEALRRQRLLRPLIFPETDAASSTFSLC
jgi:hypothetical protein